MFEDVTKLTTSFNSLLAKILLVTARKTTHQNQCRHIWFIAFSSMYNRPKCNLLFGLAACDTWVDIMEALSLNLYWGCIDQIKKCKIYFKTAVGKASLFCLSSFCLTLNLTWKLLMQARQLCLINRYRILKMLVRKRYSILICSFRRTTCKSLSFSKVLRKSSTNFHL